jgi:hypothetical protein
VFHQQVGQVLAFVEQFGKAAIVVIAAVVVMYVVFRWWMRRRAVKASD